MVAMISKQNNHHWSHELLLPCPTVTARRNIPLFLPLLVPPDQTLSQQHQKHTQEERHTDQNNRSHPLDSLLTEGLIAGRQQRAGDFGSKGGGAGRRGGGGHVFGNALEVIGGLGMGYAGGT